MQGKSRFKVASVEPAHVKELRALSKGAAELKRASPRPGPASAVGEARAIGRNTDRVHTSRRASWQLLALVVCNAGAASDARVSPSIAAGRASEDAKPAKCE